MSEQHPHGRVPSLPSAVIRALLNPALDDLWLHLLQPLPDERTEQRYENAVVDETAARGGGR
jgi:hypothetical protein